MVSHHVWRDGELWWRSHPQSEIWAASEALLE